MTRSQCKVSDTQVTVKACGPLVVKCYSICTKFEKCTLDLVTMKVLTDKFVGTEGPIDGQCDYFRASRIFMWGPNLLKLGNNAIKLLTIWTNKRK